MSHVYCPECGFQNPGTSKFCSRCGARLIPDAPSPETTMSLSPEEVAEASGAVLDDAGVRGPALVVRSGGGRAGETFFPRSERTLIGRSPECDVFLDDVTVSRKHAELVRDGDRWTVTDLGSLNGTFVNRRRIDSAPLEDDDELQVGKYRLTFLLRR